MPVFSSKMTLFGKAGLYTIIGMVSASPQRGHPFPREEQLEWLWPGSTP